jgi:YD repeat-containing protein
VARYRLSPTGERVRKRTWPVSPCQPVEPTASPERDTLFTYDLQGRLLAENHTYGVYKRAYLYLHDMPVGMIFVTDD